MLAKFNFKSLKILFLLGPNPQILNVAQASVKDVTLKKRFFIFFGPPSSWSYPCCWTAGNGEWPAVV